MAVTSTRLPLILTTATSLMGLLAVGGGVHGIVNPLGFSKSIGIEVTSANSAALPFVSFAASRNLGTGITLLTMLYAGQRRVVGAMLMCGVTVAMTDAWICAKFGAAEGKAAGHAFMGVLVGALGWGMYYYGG